MPVQLQCPQQSEAQTELIGLYQVCGGVARDGGRKWGTSPEVHMSHSDHRVLVNPHTPSLNGTEGVLLKTGRVLSSV